MDTSSGAVHAPPSHHARPSHVVAVLVGTRECPALREVILRETPVLRPCHCQPRPHTLQIEKMYIHITTNRYLRRSVLP